MGIFFVPIDAVAFATIPSARLDEASATMALTRGIGSSVGLAVVSWLLVRQTQINWEDVGAHVSPLNSAVPACLSTFSAQGLISGHPR
jgi:MFS transporter, DHA2 family, multidrug resistance protein